MQGSAVRTYYAKPAILQLTNILLTYVIGKLVFAYSFSMFVCMSTISELHGVEGEQSCELCVSQNKKTTRRIEELRERLV
jgi:hypothetical protein